MSGVVACLEALRALYRGWRTKQPSAGDGVFTGAACTPVRLVVYPWVGNLSSWILQLEF